MGYFIQSATASPAAPARPTTRFPRPVPVDNFGETAKNEVPQFFTVESGYRFYSPELGRWLSRDPIGEEGSINTIAYIGNSAIVSIDFIGLIEGGTRAGEIPVIHARNVFDAIREVKTMPQRPHFNAWQLTAKLGPISTSPAMAVGQNQAMDGKCICLATAKSWRNVPEGRIVMARWIFENDSRVTDDQRLLWKSVQDLIEVHEQKHHAIYEKYANQLTFSLEVYGEAPRSHSQSMTLACEAAKSKLMLVWESDVNGIREAYYAEQRGDWHDKDGGQTHRSIDALVQNYHRERSQEGGR